MIARRNLPQQELRRACARVAANVLHARGLRALAETSAAMEAVLHQLERSDAAARNTDAEVERLVSAALGPDAIAPAGPIGVDRRFRKAPRTGTPSPAHQLRELLYACVHPGLPPERQSGMLLRFACWFPTDTTAELLQTGAPTVDIHLRQCCRRLRAVSRRGGAAGASGHESCLSLLRLLDRLRQRGAELAESVPALAEAVDADTLYYASLIIETESGSALGEAHAFLAQVLLGAERARRGAARGTGPVLSVGAPREDGMAAGLRHLKSAMELGAQDRFLWLARIHASYLLPANGGDIDWRALVSLYEGLLGTTESPASPAKLGSSAA